MSFTAKVPTPMVTASLVAEVAVATVVVPTISAGAVVEDVV